MFATWLHLIAPQENTIGLNKYCSLSLGLTKSNYFILDSINKQIIGSLCLKSQELFLVKCLKFGKLLILENMEEISLCFAILLSTL
jgi:hypothetical protein